LVVSFSSFPDETTAEAHLVLPDHTFLESWGDYSPAEGIYGLMQPVMPPVFQTKMVGDTLLSIAQKVGKPMAERLPWPNFYEYLLEQWKGLHQRLEPQTPFDAYWEEALKRGGLWREVRAEPVRLSPQVFQMTFQEARFEGQEWAELPLYLHLYPSPIHFDGRMANRPWLQELPDPMTQLVWDNWLEIHPETARGLGIAEGDVVKVISPYGTVELPAHLTEGVRPDVFAIPLGQGHTTFGRYAEKRGANPMALLPPKPEPLSGSAMFLSTKVRLIQTGKRHQLVSPVGSDRQENRGIIQMIPLTEVGESREAVHEPKQIYPPHDHPEHRWGMAIDLNACIGCEACVVACYAENNVPVVGKERIQEGRWMAWIRIERYVEEKWDRPEIRFLPMLCQHCDNAPCEPVCPVYAAYHTPEGLNAQVYNRCVGVRYCANNCPYKVRRFNWFEYADPKSKTSAFPEPINWQLNPDVTVRGKGIMEKCTFCIQRIQAAKDLAKDEGRPVRDGEIIPACAQTCPTRAIVFGDLKDPNSEVSKLSRNPRRYRVLEPLNTQPAITYLKKIIQDVEQV
ncbi:MAG: molybdopterin dinucleotide binding domain-containing protein, partial [Candidatus Methylomirabilales bacterium]